MCPPSSAGLALPSPSRVATKNCLCLLLDDGIFSQAEPVGLNLEGHLVEHQSLAPFVDLFVAWRFGWWLLLFGARPPNWPGLILMAVASPEALAQLSSACEQAIVLVPGCTEERSG